MVKRVPIPKTDAAKDLAAMAAKKPSRRGAHLKGLTEHERPASGIPAMGDGYGGEAKGERALIVGAHTKDRIADKKATRERMRALYERFADDESLHPMVRIAAADKLLDRLEGKPANLNVNLDADDLDRLSDADLRAEAERLADQIADAEARKASAKAEPGRLPH